MLVASGGCSADVMAGAFAAPKARKNVKVRRHTTAARLSKPEEAGALVMGAGRPVPT
jgi:hypothetical protein